MSFCVEMYARRHEMSGEAVMRLFDGLGVCEFLVESYDPLHSLDRPLQIRATSRLLVLVTSGLHFFLWLFR